MNQRLAILQKAVYSPKLIQITRRPEERCDRFRFCQARAPAAQ